MSQMRFEPEQERVDALEGFLQDEGGVVLSAATKEEAMTLMKTKMQRAPNLFSEARLPLVLWTLQIFSKTQEQLLEAFLAHAAVRHEDVVVGFDCEKAFKRLCVYAEVISSHKRLFTQDPPLDLDAIRLVEELQAKTVSIQDHGALGGGIALSRFDMEAITPESMPKFSRYLFFVLHSMIFDADSQEHGIIAINDYKDFDFAGFFKTNRGRKINETAERRRAAMLKLLTQGMPLKFK
eukprot:CAMPEP_0179464668 /NCGR_PEP_ID=MMETSP0799-20121207/46431_1 /TAXON_ID=46947 /ORGANISM="Geminigera cryophila, Strain CCMP2564" /LENGTH=236 /DNA_ID=CAMNT_0021268575 /DNA_START=58 /DNA_END=765 /DNA_ORIENTATION=+